MLERQLRVLVDEDARRDEVPGDDLRGLLLQAPQVPANARVQFGRLDRVRQRRLGDEAALRRLRNPARQPAVPLTGTAVAGGSPIGRTPVRLRTPVVPPGAAPLVRAPVPVGTAAARPVRGRAIAPRSVLTRPVVTGPVGLRSIVPAGGTVAPDASAVAGAPVVVPDVAAGRRAPPVVPVVTTGTGPVSTTRTPPGIAAVDVPVVTGSLRRTATVAPGTAVAPRGTAVPSTAVVPRTTPIVPVVAPETRPGTGGTITPVAATAGAVPTRAVSAVTVTARAVAGGTVTAVALAPRAVAGGAVSAVTLAPRAIPTRPVVTRAVAGALAAPRLSCPPVVPVPVGASGRRPGIATGTVVPPVARPAGAVLAGRAIATRPVVAAVAAPVRPAAVPATRAVVAPAVAATVVPTARRAPVSAATVCAVTVVVAAGVAATTCAVVTRAAVVGAPAVAGPAARSVAGAPTVVGRPAVVTGPAVVTARTVVPPATVTPGGVLARAPVLTPVVTATRPARAGPPAPTGLVGARPAAPVAVSRPATAGTLPVRHAIRVQTNTVTSAVDDRTEPPRPCRGQLQTYEKKGSPYGVFTGTGSPF